MVMNNNDHQMQLFVILRDKSRRRVATKFRIAQDISVFITFN